MLKGVNISKEYVNISETNQLSDIESDDEPEINNVIDFPKKLLMTTKNRTVVLYNIPPKSSKDARRIWKKANIPSYATQYTIELRLIDWALKYAHLVIINQHIEKITWKICGATKCTANWTTFLHWILSATKSNDVN